MYKSHGRATLGDSVIFIFMNDLSGVIIVFLLFVHYILCLCRLGLMVWPDWAVQLSTMNSSPMHPRAGKKGSPRVTYWTTTDKLIHFILISAWLNESYLTKCNGNVLIAVREELIMQKQSEEIINVSSEVCAKRQRFTPESSKWVFLPYIGHLIWIPTVLINHF